MLDLIMPYCLAFLVGGVICVCGQLIIDVGRLQPAHMTTTLVVIGAILDGLGYYEPMIEFAGAGVTVPSMSFGNSLVHGALSELDRYGYTGILTGMFEVTSGGISAAIIFSFLAALFIKPKG